MDSFNRLWLSCATFCFFILIIAYRRRFRIVRVKDILAMLIISLIPILNVVSALILSYPFFEKFLNKIVFEYKE